MIYLLMGCLSTPAGFGVTKIMSLIIGIRAKS